ncbi:hypothetical protein EVAR_102181_1 [Eumeta japonica]|uniref:Uncharacterized protein n=1 Tax=Eumeta variegata TaxID=151549 RepID=A0A4C1ZD42_EUMVA|nr:hypothetical protein EVAR_102181_1 [Eumeta japonica]
MIEITNIKALMFSEGEVPFPAAKRQANVVSADSSCCAWLCAAEEAANALLAALAGCASRAPLAVRLAYTLGNMAAADEKARINFVENCQYHYPEKKYKEIGHRFRTTAKQIYTSEGGVDVLLTVLESYTERSGRDVPEPLADPDVHLVDSDLGGSDGSSEDVLIKTVRVIANMCLAESAGRGLAAAYAHRTVRALLSCLTLAERPTCEDNDKTYEHDENEGGGDKATRARERREELATAALATLSNVTFYREPPEPPDPLHRSVDELCQVERCQLYFEEPSVGPGVPDLRPAGYRGKDEIGLTGAGRGAAACEAARARQRVPLAAAHAPGANGAASLWARTCSTVK